MAKYKLQEMSDVHHDGKRKVYPKMVANQSYTISQGVYRQDAGLSSWHFSEYH